MRKLVSVFAVFGLAALVAAYVAVAPLASTSPGALQAPLAMFDQGALRISEIGGRSIAVLALLGGGAVLGMIAAFLVGGSARSEADDLVPAPGPVWRPEPLRSEDRIASLWRRVGADVEEAPALGLDVEEVRSEATEDAATPICPVVLVRRVRLRGEAWPESASWLGGLPRLGGAEWPRDPDGIPLPFAAQIDLATLAEACPQSRLPREGSLAFFLGTGAVVAVPPGDHDFAAPPADLPPAYDEGGDCLPASRSRLSRDFFPFWPVDALALPLPENMLEDRSTPNAINAMVRERFGDPSSALSTGDEGRLWWYGVFHLADQLHEAMDGADKVVAREGLLARNAEEMLAELATRGETSPEAVAEARSKADEIEARRQDVEQEAAALPAMVQALDGFIANRDPWEPLTAEERDLVVEILDEIHRRHGKLVQHSLPHSLAPLQAICIRAMASGAPEAFAALPEDVRERIANEHRVPAGLQHQVFDGVGSRGGDTDLLLLQLGYDDMAEWRWKDAGALQFRISVQDAAAGNWARAWLAIVYNGSGG